MSSDPSDLAPSDLNDLLERQARLRGWIERLDDPQEDVPPHVAARVRADYEARLEALVQELRAHGDALRDGAARLREALLAARDRRSAAEDALAEARLRHRLGELDNAEWGERRGEMESAVADTQFQEHEAAEELSRLEALLGQLDAPAAEPLPPLESSTMAMEAAAEPAPEPEGEPDVAAEFLEELDGAIAEGEAQEELDTRPTPGVKCAECGYTNDATAWYCGVCGADLS